MGILPPERNCCTLIQCHGLWLDYCKSKGDSEEENRMTSEKCNHCNDGSPLSWQHSIEHLAAQGHLYGHICAGHLHYTKWARLPFERKLFELGRG